MFHVSNIFVHIFTFLLYIRTIFQFANSKNIIFKICLYANLLKLFLYIKEYRRPISKGRQIVDRDGKTGE